MTYLIIIRYTSKLFDDHTFIYKDNISYLMECLEPSIIHSLTNYLFYYQIVKKRYRFSQKKRISALQQIIL